MVRTIPKPSAAATGLNHLSLESHGCGATMDDKITVRISSELKRAIDRFRNEGEGSFRSTQDAYRHIMASWLSDKGYFVPRQDEQKTQSEWKSGGEHNDRGR